MDSQRKSSYDKARALESLEAARPYIREAWHETRATDFQKEMARLKGIEALCSSNNIAVPDLILASYDRQFITELEKEEKIYSLVNIKPHELNSRAWLALRKGIADYFEKQLEIKAA